MAIHHKALTVYFYAIEPVESTDKSAPRFELGAYPLGDVLNTIRLLDPAAEDYRIKDSLFGGETFCVLHEDGPKVIMGAYYRDNLSKPLTEYKGEVGELFLREGEALVDAAYAAFFPGDVVGLVRTSSKAPGFAKIGSWLSWSGGYPCGLIALRDSNTLAQLDDHPTKLQRVLVRVRRSRLGAMAESSSDVAGALRKAADISPLTSEVGLELRVGKSQNQGEWSRSMRQEVEELLEVLPDFEEAKVKLSGIKKPVNLLRGNIQRSVEVSIDGSRRVGPNEAADALFQAYDLERGSISSALEARRER